MAKNKIKSERHHWWPECLSNLWKDNEGMAHWVLPDGTVRHMPPKNLGVIGNGHHIKLGNNGESTPWDECFESAFQEADANFPAVIRWLDSLEREARPNARDRTSRLLAQPSSDEMIRWLVEGLVSLAVRSPMSRQSAVALAEHFRGQLPSRERNALIGMNLRNNQRMVADSIGTRGKYAVIYSPDCEFIFGDGFFHNVTSPNHPPHSTTILAPLTPRISVLLARPMQYNMEPRLVTLVLSAEEAEAFNCVVQVYSKDMLFFRYEPPKLTDDYRRGEHLQFSEPGHIVDDLIESLPGVPQRNRMLDSIFCR